MSAQATDAAWDGPTPRSWFGGPRWCRVGWTETQTLNGRVTQRTCFVRVGRIKFEVIFAAKGERP